MAAFSDMVGETVKQLFCAVARSDQGGIYDVLHKALRHVILYKASTAMFGETIDKRVDKYFETGKADGSIGKQLLLDHWFLALIASIVQPKTVDAITEQCRVNVFRSTSMTTVASRMQPWQQRTALCKKYCIVRDPYAPVSRALLIASHAKPATLLSVNPVETESRS